MLLNPWVILGLVLAFLGVGAGGYYEGHGNGVAGQKVTDQRQFDDVNRRLEDMKTQARKVVADSEQHALDDARHDQEVQKEIAQHDQDNRDKTTALERKYAGLSLQYGTPQAPGRGNSGADSVSASGAPASAARTTVNQLPDSLAAGLRQHAAEADGWVDEYRKCYAGSQALSAWLAAHAGPSNGH